MIEVRMVLETGKVCVTVEGSGDLKALDPSVERPVRNQGGKLIEVLAETKEEAERRLRDYRAGYMVRKDESFRAAFEYEDRVVVDMQDSKETKATGSVRGCGMMLGSQMVQVQLDGEKMKDSVWYDPSVVRHGEAPAVESVKGETLQALAARLDGKSVTIVAEAHEDGNLLVPLGRMEIARAINAEFRCSVLMTQVAYHKSITELGVWDVPLYLGGEARTMMKVWAMKEAEEEDEPESLGAEEYLVPIVRGGPWDYGGEQWERWMDGMAESCLTEGYTVRNGGVYSHDGLVRMCEARPGVVLKAPVDWTGDLPAGCQWAEGSKPESERFTFGAPVIVTDPAVYTKPRRGIVKAHGNIAGEKVVKVRVEGEFGRTLWHTATNVKLVPKEAKAKEDHKTLDGSDDGMAWKVLVVQHDLEGPLETMSPHKYRYTRVSFRNANKKVLRKLCTIDHGVLKREPPLPTRSVVEQLCRIVMDLAGRMKHLSVPGEQCSAFDGCQSEVEELLTRSVEDADWQDPPEKISTREAVRKLARVMKKITREYRTVALAVPGYADRCKEEVREIEDLIRELVEEGTEDDA